MPTYCVHIHLNAYLYYICICMFKITFLCCDKYQYQKQLGEIRPSFILHATAIRVRTQGRSLMWGQKECCSLADSPQLKLSFLSYKAGPHA